MPRASELQRIFGDRLQQEVSLARFTSSRTGGVADFLIEIHSAGELQETAIALWKIGAAFRVLGGGSNVLVADEGVRQVVVLNRARRARFDQAGSRPSVRAESGASLGGVGRRAATRLRPGWAATVPGTVGGAVAGNSGAHGSDVARSLETAEILQRNKHIEAWPVRRFEYGYRTSWLKQHPGEAVVLTVVFRLEPSTPAVAKARVEANVLARQRTQPSGASWGSMFKNPPGDFAGRLVEAAGMKGVKIGQAEISTRHANFFINRGGASAADVARLLIEARRRVRQSAGVDLELEIELFGDWPHELREALK
jgi:UDP-N-acetylmuramate dehydrogenase